ncbi:MAG: hypothetical protein IKH12_09930 [Clostridia bacterium]|jgi:phenylpyruvate tautomerase PptA (4-oxalocrotonate tautomerase family)|nr:hypothetical protein [Clostridia bacterium]MBQ6092413.1 hypothetical protein [Clostridia bacterium]MBR3095895.1 hypothetical protein [Clostridia bacterium]
MPYINIKTSKAVTPQQETELKTALGTAITALGKSEAWLMVEIEDNRRLWFRGENTEPMALAEVELFGKASEDQYDRMTKEICGILSGTLGIGGEEIYVKYEEIDHWGYNSFNF